MLKGILIVGVVLLIVTLVRALFVGRAGKSIFVFDVPHFARWLFHVLPARKTVWGVIYDADTLQPIPFARVELLDMQHRALEVQVADVDGRYGFLESFDIRGGDRPIGFISVSAVGYRFPATGVSRLSAFMYGPVYSGDLIYAHNEQLVNYDIPMSRVVVADTNARSRRTPSVRIGAFAALMADVSFWLGMVTVPLSFYLIPGYFSMGIFCMFLGLASLRVFGVRERPFGVIRDAHSGAPVSYALVTLLDMQGKRVAYALSDERGRYFLQSPKGNYRLTVVTSTEHGVVHRYSETIRVSRGWITQEIRIPT